MPAPDPRRTARRDVTRRDFLKRAGWTSAGMTALAVGAGGGRPSAQPATTYPDWIPASTKPPKRGGVLTRASQWDPPVIDPRLTQSVGLFQFAGLTSSRLIRYAFPDEATGTSDLTLKGDLAESWQSSPDYRIWTFKLRQGVKWHNIPPLSGRELVAGDVKYCFEAYAKEGVQSFNFREIEGMETPDKHTLRVHLHTPNVLFPQNVAESVTIIFSREVLEEDGDLKKRMIGTGPYILKEHTRKERVVLARHRDARGGVPHRTERFHLAGEPLRGGDHSQDQSGRRRAVVPQHAHAVRVGARAGQAALQRPAGAARHLDGHRPPEAGRHGVRGPRHPRLGRPVHLLPGQGAHRGAARSVVAIPACGGQEAPPNGFETTLFYYEYF